MRKVQTTLDNVTQLPSSMLVLHAGTKKANGPTFPLTLRMGRCAWDTHMPVAELPTGKRARRVQPSHLLCQRAKEKM
eukprot:365517-Chlamydomonas_euryale.AAC.4